MLTVGDTLPLFSLTACVSMEAGREFRVITSSSFKGRWLVLFYWPLSFTKHFPPELSDFGRRYADFLDRDADVLGATTDAPYIHVAWRKEHPALHNLPYPVLADQRRDLARRLGVVGKDQEKTRRTTFVIDPEGVIRWAAAYSEGIERSAADVLRVLDSLLPVSRRPVGRESSRPQPLVRAPEGEVGAA